MNRRWHLLPVLVPALFLLALLQLLAAANAQPALTIVEPNEPQSVQSSSDSTLLQWSQSVTSEERQVLLQWTELPEELHRVYLPMLVTPGSRSSAAAASAPRVEAGLTVYRRELGTESWQSIGTVRPAEDTTEMVSLLSRDLADQLAWDLRSPEQEVALTDGELYKLLLSEDARVTLASQSYYQIDLVRGQAFLDKFAPLEKSLEYYVAGAGLRRTAPVAVAPDAELPAPTGLREVFPGPAELGKQGSSYPDNQENRYRWDFYQQWRQWDGSVSLFWDTPSTDPGDPGGNADTADAISMRGYYVYRTEPGKSDWQLVNPVGQCQTSNRQLCTIPVRVSAVPGGVVTEETYLFRDQLNEQFVDSKQVYREWDYKVCAVDQLGSEACSTRITAYGRDLNPPAPATGVQVEQPDGGPIRLSWTYTDSSEVSGPLRFYVTRHITLTTPADQWEPVYPAGSALPYQAAPIQPSITISITDSPDTGQPYWFQVQVRDGAGNFSPLGAPLMGALFPRTAPSLPDINYDKNNCRANPLPLSLQQLDAAIMLLNLYRAFTPTGPWTLVEQVPVVNGTAVVDDNYIPPNPIEVHYALEAVDAHGNVSPPEYYCSRLYAGTTPPPPTVEAKLVYEGGRWFVPLRWTGTAETAEVTITQPGMEGESSTTVRTKNNPYLTEVNLGAWIEATVAGQNGNGTGEGTTVWLHPTNNYLDTNRQMTDLGSIRELTWQTNGDNDPVVRLDLTGDCDQCRSLPWTAAFRRTEAGSWLQVTPVEPIPRPSSDAPWVITDTTDLSPNETYEYVVLAISPDSYEVLGFWGSTKIAPLQPRQAVIRMDDPFVAATLWPEGCPYDVLRPSSAGMPEYVDLANGWTLRAHYYFFGSSESTCAPVKEIDPAHLYGDGLLSNGTTDWRIVFGDIGLNPTTGEFVSGRIMHKVDLTIDEPQRLRTHINRIEFQPGTGRAEVTLTLPKHTNIIHPDQGRNNQIFFVASGLQTDFNFTIYRVDDLLMVDENLPWIVHYSRGAFEADRIGSSSARVASETYDRFRYRPPALEQPARPDNNLAFMRPRYNSFNADFTRAGLSGDFETAASINYVTSFPAAVVLSADGASLRIQESQIVSGRLINAAAQLDYLNQDTVKDYMLVDGRCTPRDPAVKVARCRGSWKTSPPSYQTLLMHPESPDIVLGAGGIFSPVVSLNRYPNWTRYEIETRRATLLVAPAAVVGPPTSWAPMPVENAWRRLPHPQGLGDLDPGLNINVHYDPASYFCFTPAYFDWSVTDLYIRRGGVSEYFMTGEDVPKDRVNEYGYTEQVLHVELTLLDNTEDPTEPVAFRTRLELPYPSEVTYPLTITAIDPDTHCPARGDISKPTTAVHRYWSFEQSPTNWRYVADLAKYGADIGDQPALFALEGAAVINGLNTQSTVQAGAPVVRQVLSEWFPNGDGGDVRLLEDDLPAAGYRVSGIKFNVSDVKLSRYYATIMDVSSLPDTLDIDLSANAGQLPAELLDANGALTPSSLKTCARQLVDGCGFVLLDGQGAVDYFGELQSPEGGMRQPQVIPLDELAGAFPIATNEVLSEAVQMILKSPEAHWIWPAANLIVNGELQRYNIPVKFLGNTQGGALVGVLANASILPGQLPEILTADLAATITVDWNDQRGYEDQIGIFAGYTASQAAFRALAMNRPQTQREGTQPFDRWDDVSADITKWAQDFGYTLDPGPDNERDDPVDLAELIWEDGWCRSWDPDPDDPERKCTDRVSSLAETYNLLEPMLQDMNGREAYGSLAVTSGQLLKGVDVVVSNGAGQAIFSPVGLDSLRFEGLRFGTRLVIEADESWRDAHLIADWLQLDFTRDGQYIFKGANIHNILVGEYGLRSDIMIIVDTRPGWEHVEGGIEVHKIEVPLLFTARAAGVVGVGNYGGATAAFVGLRGEASTNELWGLDSEMSLVIMAGLLPAQSTVIDEFDFGDVLDKFGAEEMEGAPAPFTGAYFALAGQWPLIDATCLLQAAAGGEMRLWYFQASNGEDKYGGQLEAHLAATIACLISGRGEVSLGFERLLLNEPVSPPPGEDPDWGPLPRTCADPDSCYAFTGSVWVAVGTGWCSPESWDSWSGARGNWWGDDWCYTFGAMVGLSYLSPPAGQDAWDYAVDLKFE